MNRTHGVNAAWLHGVYEAGNFTMRYEVSDEMVADIFTKAFRELPKWQHAVNLIGMGVRTSGGNIAVPYGSSAAKKAQANKGKSNNSGAAKPKSKDFWDNSEEGWLVTCHVEPRQCLATPFGLVDSPQPGELTGRRVTEIQYLSGQYTDRDEHFESWDESFAHSPLKEQWMGLTKYELAEKKTKKVQKKTPSASWSDRNANQNANIGPNINIPISISSIKLGKELPKGSLTD